MNPWRKLYSISIFEYKETNGISSCETNLHKVMVLEAILTSGNTEILDN